MDGRDYGDETTGRLPYKEYVKKLSQVRHAHLQGLGGAPTRATTLPADPAERKTYPVASGLLDYFPDALAAISHVSWKGNEQHNPGQPLHWARSKSTDEADTMLRHFLERGSLDKDGIRHSAKMAWRALAYLQKEIEAEKETQNGSSPVGECEGGFCGVIYTPQTACNPVSRPEATQARSQADGHYEDEFGSGLPGVPVRRKGL